MSTSSSLCVSVRSGIGVANRISISVSLDLVNITQNATAAMGSINDPFTVTMGDWETRSTLYGPEGKYHYITPSLSVASAAHTSTYDLLTTRRK